MDNTLDHDTRARTLRLDGNEYLLLSFRSERAVHSDSLTPAERAVAESVLAGASNAQIARERRRSVRTVANQIASLFKKLRVRSRLELAQALAWSQGTQSPIAIATARS
jgi:DNA-binding NarL/FixJ family response regulator